ncbi:ciliary-associated calcium-binding coiled-coil protein 1 [Egretta garzetta]|nr:ciliary-associated calcium-binding coiled-coil protein 1 [Egretta garzetta]
MRTKPLATVSDGVAPELQAPIACLGVGLLCEAGVLGAGWWYLAASLASPWLPLVVTASPAVLQTVSHFQRQLGKITKEKYETDLFEDEGMPFEEEDQDQDAIGGKIINRTFLSLSQIIALSGQNVEGVQKKLEEFLNFKQLKTSLKEAVLLDYYTAGFCWAKEMNFSLIQLSGFMDLLNFLLENLSDKHMTLGDNLKELGKAMAGIGETDSERSGDLNFFSIEQAKAVIDYLNISLFKHYKLYEYLFHSPREEFVISNEYVIELAQPAVPPFPAPLEEGMPLDIYSSFIISPTASETESKGSDQEGYPEEPGPEVESFEADAVAGVTAEDENSAVDEIPNEIIGNLEVLLLESYSLILSMAEINEKLQMQEEAYTLRTEKLESPK